MGGEGVKDMAHRPPSPYDRIYYLPHSKNIFIENIVNYLHTSHIRPKSQLYYLDSFELIHKS
jgi:hypothetical protein